MKDTIFALDTSGKTAGACLLQNGAVAAEEYLHTGLTHSETLLPLVQRVFASVQLAPADIELWAVTAGPGSFTGLRIGMALAKGMALPYTAPMAAVSTLQALAIASGLPGIVVPALDARRSEVYWAAFDGRNDFERLLPDTAGPAKALTDFLQKAGSPVFFVGDGAKICYNMFGSLQNVFSSGSEEVLPIAKGAAFAAKGQAAQIKPASASVAQPRYLRLSQAERERAKRLNIL